MAKKRKQETLLAAISEAIPHIKKSFPKATDDEISDAIMDYISSLVSDPSDLITKLTLPTNKEMAQYSRMEYLKAQRSKLKFKRLEEAKFRTETVAMLAEIKEQMDEDGMTEDAKIFSDHITGLERNCVEKTGTLMRIDSDISRLIRYSWDKKNDGDDDLERIWSLF